MKFNQWTLALAAVGAVSLVSAARADEAKISQVQTALSSTTLSGYVDVAAQYNLGNPGVVDDANVPPTSSGAGNASSKIDSFSLNDVDIALDKPEDDSPWASGYHIELNYGNDAVAYDPSISSSGTYSGIRQAYVTVRTPIGSGIDWKIGIQDNIIGYEGNTDAANPNYTRSLGYYLEPTTYLGIIGTYTVNKYITIEGGVANDTSFYPGNNSSKAYLGDIAFTAPDSWGFIKGATLNVGVNAQFATDSYFHGQDNYYAGVVLPTPWSPLKVGGSFDLVSYTDKSPSNSKDDSAWDLAAYANYQATDKLSLNLRGEYLKDDVGDYLYPYSTGNGSGNQAEEVTATVQYNLWANVVSRAEFRWDHAAHGTQFGEYGGDANAYMLAVNLIYQF